MRSLEAYALLDPVGFAVMAAARPGAISAGADRKHLDQP
jgi:hypothetical protein